MTYFLEKNFTLDAFGKMIPNENYTAYIRPCKTDYEDIIKIFASKKSATIDLDASIEIFSLNGHNSFSNSSQKFNSIEEWLISVELEKGITIDFEDILLMPDTKFSSYLVKTTDMHTKNVLFDSIDQTIEEIMKTNK